MSKYALTSPEYAARGGSDCPVCGAKTSVRLEGPLEADGSVAWANCSCEACEAIWTEEYRLIGYDNVELPQKDGRPATTAEAIPAREAWLHKNKAALASLMRGLEQAGRGEFAEPPDLAEDAKLVQPTQQKKRKKK